MEIVTGKVGTPHISSADDRALNAGIIGTGNYVLNVGSKFNATIETSNNIVIADGDLVINGTHARIPHGNTDTVIIENGTTGYNRIDLIVARYTKKSDIESVELKVIKGETVSGTPTRPSYTPGNVLADAEIADMPLYAVQLSGVNVASITPLFTISTGLDDVYRKKEVYTKDEVNSIKQNLQSDFKKDLATKFNNNNVAIITTAVITPTMLEPGAYEATASIAYPSGFTKDNCFVIPLHRLSHSGNASNWHINTVSSADMSVYCDFLLGNKIMFEYTVRYTDTSQTFDASVQGKAILIKL